MLKTLIKKQLLELFRTYYINEKTGKARSKKETVRFYAFLVILFGGLGFAFYNMADRLGASMLGYGFDWLYFALMGLLSMVLGAFGSVFNTYASVYLPKDNEQLMVLPIPDRTLLLSRLCGVYITSLMYSAWVWIPSTIAYWMHVPANVLNVVFPILLTFVIGLFVSVLSCALGWVVALIATKAKGKSFLTVILSLMVMVLYYIVYFKIVGALSKIATHLDQISSAIKSWLYYSYLLGMAAEGRPLQMFLIVAITSALAGICFIVLSKTFKHLALAESKTAKKAVVDTDYRQYSPRSSLIRREYKHFTSVSTWMLNGGLGLLILPVLAIVLCVKSESIRAILQELAVEMPALSSAFPVILLASICMIISMVNITPVSISMEAKTVWILQSLPVDAWSVLKAKEKMSIQLNQLPAIVFVIISGIVFQISWVQQTLLLGAVLAYIGLMADFGLFLDLRHTNLNWTNAAMLTKQSLPVIVTMFGGWGLSVALGFGGYFLCRIINVSVVLGIYAVLFTVLWIMLAFWLKYKGTKLWREL